MTTELITVERRGDTVAITMDRPERRNALSFEHLGELLEAFTEAASSDATGVILAGNGPVFSAGHDFASMAGADLMTMRRLLRLCTDVVEVMTTMPQIVVARVHGLATAAGAQLVASCDLAVAAESAGFAAPGGKGGWFCTTPMVAIGRSIGRKQAAEMAFTGDAIDAETALRWGLVNQVVPDDELDAAVAELLGRATRGSAASRAMGKTALYTQLSMSDHDAYAYAIEVMAAASQTADGREAMTAFVDKRPPVWQHR
ncbi:MAG: enoyl-CoA hydratase-related protein [Acidimicrobiales bacterium]